MAFAHHYERFLEPEIRDAARWLFDAAEPYLCDAPPSPWHHRSHLVLPDDGLLGNVDFRDVEDERDFLDLCLISWRNVTSNWTILDFRLEDDRRAA